MTSRQSRRHVLKAVAGSCLAVGVAGCTSTIPGIGGSTSACSAAEAFFEASIEGDTETAIEYVPYEYRSDLSESDARAQYEMTDRQQQLLAGMDIEFACECEKSLDESEIGELETNIGDNEITAATEVLFVTSISGEVMGQEIDEEDESTIIMVEIDGDGWYVWDSSQSFGKC